MTDLVDPEEIERIVGVQRHPTLHYARAVQVMDRVYILHSQECRDSGIDLRDCPYSRALDNGITDRQPWTYWRRVLDRPVPVKVWLDGEYLLPDLMGLRVRGTNPRGESQ